MLTLLFRWLFIPHTHNWLMEHATFTLRGRLQSYGTSWNYMGEAVTFAFQWVEGTTFVYRCIDCGNLHSIFAPGKQVTTDQLSLQFEKLEAVK